MTTDIEAIAACGARIAELEAENQTQIDNATFWRKKSYKAEAALAERERMLRLAGEAITDDQHERWLADLRARAEEGSET